MANHTVTRFFRLNSALMTDEYRTDEATSALLGYVDHIGNGTAEVLVSDPYTGRTRQYTARPTSKALGIISRHVEVMGYKYCLRFQNLTAVSDAGKL